MKKDLLSILHQISVTDIRMSRTENMCQILRIMCAKCLIQVHVSPNFNKKFPYGTLPIIHRKSIYLPVFFVFYCFNFILITFCVKIKDGDPPSVFPTHCTITDVTKTFVLKKMNNRYLSIRILSSNASAEFY